MILGIDTALDALSVALAEGGLVAASLSVRRKNMHDALLVPGVRELLAAVGLRVSDLAGVAVSAGPGSFTGLRIGMAAAKGFALAAGIPLLAVPTLDAIAHRVALAAPRGMEGTLGIALDARRDDVYAGIYHLAGGKAVRERGAFACTAAELASLLPDGAMLAGDAGEKIEAVTPDIRYVFPADLLHATAESVACLGEDLLARGDVQDVAQCEPQYVRDFRTTTKKSG